MVWWKPQFKPDQELNMEKRDRSWPVMGKNGAVNRNRFYLYTSKYYYRWGRCIIGADIYY